MLTAVLLVWGTSVVLVCVLVVIEFTRHGEEGDRHS